jgi:hypothetical protein
VQYPAARRVSWRVGRGVRLLRRHRWVTARCGPSPRAAETSASSAANSSDHPLNACAGQPAPRTVPWICSSVTVISAVTTNRAGPLTPLRSARPGQCRITAGTTVIWHEVRDSGQRRADDAVALATLALTRGEPRGNEDTFAVLHGLYWLTVDIAKRTPLLLAVDDLHWADQPSQRFVAYLTRRLEGLAVVLVLTVREPRLGTAQQKALTAGLAAEASVIMLRPAALSTAACAELVSGTLGTDPSPAFQDACRDLTGGNPLLLRGLLTSLAAEGMAGTDAEVPHLRRLTPAMVARSVLLQLGSPGLPWRGRSGTPRPRSGGPECGHAGRQPQGPGGAAEPVLHPRTVPRAARCGQGVAAERLRRAEPRGRHPHRGG